MKVKTSNWKVYNISHRDEALLKYFLKGNSNSFKFAEKINFLTE